MSLPTQNDITDAIKRIANTSDGKLLYRFLQLVLVDVQHSTDTGALQAQHGRRLLARELKLLMDEELSKGATSSVRRDHHDPDAPAVVRPAVAVSVNRTGTSRRVDPYPDDAGSRGAS